MKNTWLRVIVWLLVLYWSNATAVNKIASLLDNAQRGHLTCSQVSTGIVVSFIFLSMIVHLLLSGPQIFGRRSD